jgi:hypothetical protein
MDYGLCLKMHIVMMLYSFQPSMDDFWFRQISKMFVSFETDELLKSP